MPPLGFRENQGILMNTKILRIIILTVVGTSHKLKSGLNNNNQTVYEGRIRQNWRELKFFMALKIQIAQF